MCNCMSELRTSIIITVYISQCMSTGQATSSQLTVGRSTAGKIPSASKQDLNLVPSVSQSWSSTIPLCLPAEGYRGFTHTGKTTDMGKLLWKLWYWGKEEPLGKIFAKPWPWASGRLSREKSHGYKTRMRRSCIWREL